MSARVAVATLAFIGCAAIHEEPVADAAATDTAAVAPLPAVVTDTTAVVPPVAPPPVEVPCRIHATSGELEWRWPRGPRAAGLAGSTLWVLSAGTTCGWGGCPPRTDLFAFGPDGAERAGHDLDMWFPDAAAWTGAGFVYAVASNAEHLPSTFGSVGVDGALTNEPLPSPCTFGLSRSPGGPERSSRSPMPTPRSNATGLGSRSRSVREPVGIAHRRWPSGAGRVAERRERALRSGAELGRREQHRRRRSPRRLRQPGGLPLDLPRGGGGDRRHLPPGATGSLSRNQVRFAVGPQHR